MNLVLGIASCAPESGPAGVARSVAPPISGSFDNAPVERCDAGGYITRVIVDPATAQAGDGQHFTRITDAVIAVRTGRIARGERTLINTACRITIDVAPGTYTGDFAPSSVKEVLPLVLDVPRVTLEGGLRMALDAKGRATGAVLDPTQNTVLQPTAPLTGTQSLIIVTDSSSGFWGDGVNDTRGDSVTVRGFELRSGYATPDNAAAGGGFGLFAMRVQGLLVEQNRFGFLLASALDARASTARLDLNSAIDLGGSCAFCLAGPGSYGVSGSTVARSGIVGVLVFSGTQSPIPAGLRPLTISSAPAAVASIENNYITGEQQHPVGTAIRIAAVGQGIATITGLQTTATLTSNDLVDNRFGVIADAGFPPLNTSTTFPSGNLSLTLGGNHFSQTCQANLLLTLARHTRGLGLPTPTANAGYLKQSTYNISLGGDVPWSEVWFSHVSTDNGVTLNNALTVDGSPIGPGALNSYSGTECGFRPSARAWIGLKNSDDVGTKFDLLTEIRRNDILMATGQLNGVNGGSSGFNNAVEQIIGTTLKGAVAVRTGDRLSVTISARIAEGVAGHTSGTARLWYGDSTAASRITTLADTVSRTLYLSPDSVLTDAPTGSRQFLDVLVKKTGGNPFKPFGTWTRVF
jgi:hypothetical protein